MRLSLRIHLLVMLLLCSLSEIVDGQQPGADVLKTRSEADGQDLPFAVVPLTPKSTSLPEPVPSLDTGTNGPSWNFWVRHIDGSLLGDSPPYTGIGASRHLFVDNGAWTFTSQGWVTNGGEGGGNVGLVRRILFDNSIVGFGLWYDVRQTRFQNVFHQASVSFDYFVNEWAIRANGYLPIGPNVRTGADTSQTGAFAFQGNDILGGQRVDRVDEAAMKGVDVELAHSLGNWNGEAFVGYYNLQGETGGQTNGVRGGLRGFLTDRLAANVSVSNDPIFGTNVYGGFTWFFGSTGNANPPTFDDKLTLPVERSNSVTVNEVETHTENLFVLTDGVNPLTVTHVRDDGTGIPNGSGTAEDPFTTLPATQGTDIVYVHADGVFNGQSYALAPNQRFLGEADGVTHMIDTAELGMVALPRATAGTNRPQILNAPGDAITLSDNNEVAGFIIDGAAQNGVLGAAVSHVVIDRNIIQNSTNLGIVLFGNNPGNSTVRVVGNDLAGNNGGNTELIVNYNGTGTFCMDLIDNSSLNVTPDNYDLQNVGTGTFHLFEDNNIGNVNTFGVTPLVLPCP